MENFETADVIDDEQDMYEVVVYREIGEKCVEYRLCSCKERLRDAFDDKIERRCK